MSEHDAIARILVRILDARAEGQLAAQVHAGVVGFVRLVAVHSGRVR
jgi:hypothetical protein